MFGRIRRRVPELLRRAKWHASDVGWHATWRAARAVGEHPATQILGELAIDVAWQTASVGIAELGDQGLRVARDQLVLGRASLVGVAQSLSGRAGRSFVESAREHPRAL